MQFPYLSRASGNTLTQEKLLLHTALDHVESVLNRDLPQAYTYHDFSHTRQVFEAADTLATLAGLSRENRLVLLLAAAFHDVGYIQGPHLHEERSAQMAADFLEGRGMPENAIAHVQELILATSLTDFNPRGLSDFLRDADLSYLGLPGFCNQADRYRTELRQTGQTLDVEREWLEFNLAFFKRHSYLTAEGRSAFDPLKKQHQLLLEEKLALYRE